MLKSREQHKKTAIADMGLVDLQNMLDQQMYPAPEELTRDDRSAITVTSSPSKSSKFMLMERDLNCDWDQQMSVFSDGKTSV